MLNRRFALGTVLLVSALTAQGASLKLVLFNMTARSDFPGVYLAPPGTDRWGENQALNDRDKSLDNEERLVLKGVAPGHFDLKLVDRQGRTCIIRNIDLATESSYEIRDEALTDCK